MNRSLKLLNKGMHKEDTFIGNKFKFDSCLYFFINLNLLIIGNSFASQLHTLIIPMMAYIVINVYKVAFSNAFKKGQANKITEQIIDTNRLNKISTINKFIPWIA